MFLTIVPIVKKLNEQIIFVIQTTRVYFSKSLVLCLQYNVCEWYDLSDSRKIGDYNINHIISMFLFWKD